MRSALGARSKASLPGVQALIANILRVCFQQSEDGSPSGCFCLWPLSRHLSLRIVTSRINTECTGHVKSMSCISDRSLRGSPSALVCASTTPDRTSPERGGGLSVVACWGEPEGRAGRCGGEAVWSEVLGDELGCAGCVGIGAVGWGLGRGFGLVFDRAGQDAVDRAPVGDFERALGISTAAQGLRQRGLSSSWRGSGARAETGAQSAGPIRGNHPWAPFAGPICRPGRRRARRGFRSPGGSFRPLLARSEGPAPAAVAPEAPRPTARRPIPHPEAPAPSPARDAPPRRAPCAPPSKAARPDPLLRGPRRPSGPTHGA